VVIGDQRLEVDFLDDGLVANAQALGALDDRSERVRAGLGRCGIGVVAL
jgi:hypothetical protein